MSDEAATPAGGAEVSARPDASATNEKPSVHDRLKAILSPEPAEQPATQITQQPEAPATPGTDDTQDDQPKDEANTDKDESANDAQDDEQQIEPKNLTELAQALGWDLEKILGLEAATKVDGKDGTRSLRDLIKSHQLEGHLNQKLMTHADEKKAFETERQNFLQTSQHKLMQMDAALQVATRMLQGEFAGVNWQELQDTNPLEFNQRYVAFQQRQAQLNQMADMLGKERQQTEAQAAAQMQTYLTEQSALLDSKIPEWSDKAKRAKDIADMAPVLSDAYGITEQELKGLKDHREILVIRDAWKWQQLQKAKPTIVNKVKSAPKLIKPGTNQSKAAQDGLQMKAARDRLKATGSLQDAKSVLKRIIF